MATVKKRDPRWYGYKRGYKDINDHPFRPKVMRVPLEVELRTHCPPIMDQGPLGSCVAHGVTALLRFNRIRTGKGDRILSRLQLYYDARVIIDTVMEDSGAYIRDGIKSAVKRGVGQEKYWGYDISKFTAKPGSSVYRSAITFNALEYQLVETSTRAVKQALASGFPVVVGFDVYESFESAVVSNTGVMPMPKVGEFLLGGHCVYITGYGQKAGYFTARNSWGVNWGDKGDFYIPEAMVNPQYMDDFWIVRGTG